MAADKSHPRLSAAVVEAFHTFPLPAGMSWVFPDPSDLPWDRRDGMISVFLGSLRARFRLDQTNFVASILSGYQISPGQLVPNSWRYLLPFSRWVHSLGEVPAFSFPSFSSIFTLSKAPHSSFYFYFLVRPQWRKLIRRSSDPDDDWKSHWAWVKYSGDLPFSPVWNSSPRRGLVSLSPMERYYLYLIRYRIVLLGFLSLDVLTDPDDCRRADLPCGLPGSEVVLPDSVPPYFSLLTIFPSLGSVIERDSEIIPINHFLGSRDNPSEASVSLPVLPTGHSVPLARPSSSSGGSGRHRVKVASSRRRLSLGSPSRLPPSVAPESGPALNPGPSEAIPSGSPQPEPLNVVRSPSGGPFTISSRESSPLLSSASTSTGESAPVGGSRQPSPLPLVPASTGPSETPTVFGDAALPEVVVAADAETIAGEATREEGSVEGGGVAPEADAPLVEGTLGRPELYSAPLTEERHEGNTEAGATPDAGAVADQAATTPGSTSHQGAVSASSQPPPFSSLFSTETLVRRMKRRSPYPVASPPTQRLRTEAPSEVLITAGPASSSSGPVPASTSAGPAPASASAGSVPASFSAGPSPASTSAGPAPASTSAGSGRAPIVSLLDNPDLAATFVSKLACPKDRAMVNSFTWAAMKKGSALDLIQWSIRRQGFIDRVEGMFSDFDAIRDQRDHAIAEFSAANADLEETRTALRQLQVTASEMKVKEEDLTMRLDEVIAARRDAEADSIASKRLLKEAEADASQVRADRDAIRIAFEDKAKQLDRAEAEAAGRERLLRKKHGVELANIRRLLSDVTAERDASKAAFEAKARQLDQAEECERVLRSELNEAKEKNAAELERVGRLRFEELAVAPGSQEAILDQMVDCYKRGFSSCKAAVAGKYPQVELDDIRPDDM